MLKEDSIFCLFHSVCAILFIKNHHSIYWKRYDERFSLELCVCIMEWDNTNGKSFFVYPHNNKKETFARQFCGEQKFILVDILFPKPPTKDEKKKKMENCVSVCLSVSESWIRKSIIDNWGIRVWKLCVFHFIFHENSRSFLVKLLRKMVKKSSFGCRQMENR